MLILLMGWSLAVAVHCKVRLTSVAVGVKSALSKVGIPSAVVVSLSMAMRVPRGNLHNNDVSIFVVGRFIDLFEPSSCEKGGSIFSAFDASGSLVLPSGSLYCVPHESQASPYRLSFSTIFGFSANLLCHCFLHRKIINTWFGAIKSNIYSKSYFYHYSHCSLPA